MMGILGGFGKMRERKKKKKKKRKKKIIMGKFFITISSWIMQVTGYRTNS
jgi:hypothetical protein